MILYGDSEGISLGENLKNHNIMMFRRFQFEYHYIDSTGETTIYANDMSHVFQGQDKNEVIADLKTEAQYSEDEILNTLENYDRHREKQRKRIR